MPGANIRNEKNEKEDDPQAIEPPSHPASYHTLVMAKTMMTMTMLNDVTSLTGKQVSTDSSKVIGEEARARLEVNY